MSRRTVYAIALILIMIALSAVTPAANAYEYEYEDAETETAEQQPPAPSPPPPPQQVYNYTAMLDTITTLLLRIVQYMESEPEAAEPEPGDFYLEYEYVMLYVLAEELLDEVRAQNELMSVGLGFVAGALIGIAVLSRWNFGV